MQQICILCECQLRERVVGKRNITSQLHFKHEMFYFWENKSTLFYFIRKTLGVSTQVCCIEVKQAGFYANTNVFLCEYQMKQRTRFSIIWPNKRYITCYLFLLKIALYFMSTQVSYHAQNSNPNHTKLYHTSFINI